MLSRSAHSLHACLPLQEVSLFVFDKKLLHDKALSKTQQQTLLDIMKHGPTQVWLPALEFCFINAKIDTIYFLWLIGRHGPLNMPGSVVSFIGPVVF